MKRKVAAMTKALMAEGGGNQDVTAQIFANFTSQRVVQPFVKVSLDSPQIKFAKNALLTLKHARKLSLKPGSQADMFRRNILVAGACGPLSPNPVCVNNLLNNFAVSVLQYICILYVICRFHYVNCPGSVDVAPTTCDKIIYFKQKKVRQPYPNS